MVLEWLCQCPPSDQWLIGKAVIPLSLYTTLRQSLPKNRAHALIADFQRHFPILMTPILDSSRPPHGPTATAQPDRNSASQRTLLPWLTHAQPAPSRKRPFVQDDWMHPATAPHGLRGKLTQEVMSGRTKHQAMVRPVLPRRHCSCFFGVFRLGCSLIAFLAGGWRIIAPLRAQFNRKVSSR